MGLSQLDMRIKAYVFIMVPGHIILVFMQMSHSKDDGPGTTSLVFRVLYLKYAMFVL